MPDHVTLKSVGNPDHGQRGAISPARKVKVTTLEDASRKCREYIDKYELGGGNWAGGDVTDGRKYVGYISYNGRIWKTRDSWKEVSA